MEPLKLPGLLHLVVQPPHPHSHPPFLAVGSPPEMPEICLQKWQHSWLHNLLLWISNQICVCVYFQCLVFCWKNKVTDTQPNILNSPSAGDLPSPRGVNPGLPHCRKILYHLSHQGSPNILNNYLHSRHSDNTEQNYLEGQMKSKPGASHHKYETTNAVENLYKKGKILSWVMTGPWNLEKRAKYIRTTWIQPCNRVMFMSSEENKDFLTVGFNTKEGETNYTENS